MHVKTNLIAGLLTTLCVFGALTGWAQNVHAQAQQNIHAIAAATPFGQEQIGDLFQEVALQQPDLVIIYGSSEITSYTTGYGANVIFQNSPTGFTPFVVGHSAMTSLIMAQTLAAMGPELKGKKIVISFTPTMFFSPEVPQDEYLGNFSTLHALELVYSDSLSMDLKARIALRMLDYPEATQKDPLLWFGANKLVSSSLVDQVMYSLAYPIGRLEIAIIKLQDDYEVSKSINQHVKAASASKGPVEGIAWQALLAQAEKAQVKNSTNNPDGVSNDIWVKNYQTMKPYPPGSRDQRFLEHLSSSKEWEDFDAMLSVLKEEGAQPLILGRPINGTLYDNMMGVSASAREAYYRLISFEVNRYGFKLVDFREHDTDKYFNIDSNSHSSPKGWVYVDQALDDFYHNRLTQGN